MDISITPYYEIPALQHVYLEDSYVLSIEAGATASIDAELALCEQHPLYRTPTPGEQHCYRRGRIIFSDVSACKLMKSDLVPATDASGQRDLGNIDEFYLLGTKFVLCGDWGRMEVDASGVAIDFGNGL